MLILKLLPSNRVRSIVLSDVIRNVFQSKGLETHWEYIGVCFVFESVFSNHMNEFYLVHNSIA
jgi:hypothetical protein